MGRRDDRDKLNTPFSGLKRLRDEMAGPPEPKLKLRHRPAAPTVPEPARSDEDLFLSEMAGARPLDEKAGRVGAPPASPRPPLRPSDDAEVLASLADLCDGASAFDFADSDEFIEGIGEGIDRRLLRRLRAGDFAVQAHVDLHGLHRDAARDRVARFIQDSRRDGLRCVLIVHGRGLHSKDQVPVLKQSLRTWLERGAIARAVLAFASARPCDGGVGAVYVLLRR